MALVQLFKIVRSSSVKSVSIGSCNISSSNSTSLRMPNLIEHSDSLAGVDDGKDMDQGSTSTILPKSILVLELS